MFEYTDCMPREDLLLWTGPGPQSAEINDIEQEGDLLLARRLWPLRHVRQGRLHGLRPNGRRSWN